VFNLFKRSNAPAEPHDRFSALSDADWLSVLVRSVTEPVIDGVPMPGFPPAELQRNTVGSTGEHALQEAFVFYAIVKKYALQAGRALNSETRVLDFGCGWGRILRFFLKDCRAANVHGVDVDPHLVAVCQSTFPYSQFAQVNHAPPTTLPDESFDVITGYSVFSHLAEPVSLAWVAELTRLLKPRGLLFVTTHPRDFIEFCRSLQGRDHEFAWHQALSKSFVETEAALAAYAAGEFLYAPTGGGPALPSEFYGEAIIPEAYVRRNWTASLNLVAFVDDRSVVPQALIVMQKPE
jgi:SAM-dependent methyltransferase